MSGIVLKAHGDTGRTQCSDCGQRGDEPTRADYMILVEDNPDWRAVCETCSYDYDWEETEVEIET